MMIFDLDAVTAFQNLAGNCEYLLLLIVLIQFYTLTLRNEVVLLIVLDTMHFAIALDVYKDHFFN